MLTTWLPHVSSSLGSGKIRRAYGHFARQCVPEQSLELEGQEEEPFCKAEFPSFSLRGGAERRLSLSTPELQLQAAAKQTRISRSLPVGCPPGKPGPWASFAASPSPERRAKSVSTAYAWLKPRCSPLMWR